MPHMLKTLNREALEKALVSQGLTQAKLAGRLGVSAQAITNWLKGENFPRPPVLLKLAAALRLTFDELILQADDPAKPVIAFRKKGASKTTLEHFRRATGIGQLLKPLVPFLADIQALRTLITSPSTDYRHLQAAATQTRKRLGVGDQAVLDYKDLIGEFRQAGAVLVPVLWGHKKRHENALHIRLPQEDVTFIFLNLDTRLEDFKFWMAHELAHVFTPELAGTNEGEDYADALAGVLLFPQPLAAQAYQAASQLASEPAIIDVLQQYAHEHMISLYSIFQETNRYARAHKLPPLAVDDKTIHIVRNSNPGPLVSAALFDPLPPEPERYIAACEQGFQSDFFAALKRMLHATGTGPSYIQQIIDIPLQDAHALHEELRH